MDNLASQTIRILRFPLSVAIVMFHSNITVYNTSAAQNSIVSRFSDFIISNICLLAVPLFFFISGYLFFHEGKFNLHIFKRKLQNRFYSLIIPYILWNSICLAIFFTLQLLIPNFNLMVHKQILDFNLSDFIMIFWNLQEVSGIKTDQMGPLVGQFWFIQCLVVYSLLTPIIWYCTKRLGALFSVLLVALSLSGYMPKVPGFDIWGLYYFSLGAYFSITKHNWNINEKYIPLLFVTYMILYITQQTIPWGILRFINDTILVFVILNIGSYFAKGRKLKPSTIYLSHTSFFIFAIHRYFTSIGLNIGAHFIFSNCVMAILCFMTISLFSVASSLAIYRLMDKYFHKVLLVLNGNAKTLLT